MKRPIAFLWCRNPNGIKDNDDRYRVACAALESVGGVGFPLNTRISAVIDDDGDVSELVIESPELTQAEGGGR